MISPPSGPTPAVAPPAPPEFFFLGTQWHGAANLHASLRAAHRPEAVPALGPFQAAVRGADERVWILDKFFDHLHGLPAVFEAAVDSSAQLRIVSAEPEPRAWLESQQSWADLRERLTWQMRPCPWLHGRFALVDGDLWHFGSTVGGSYPGFDAATRWGAPAIVESFQYHFDNVWREYPQ